MLSRLPKWFDCGAGVCRIARLMLVAVLVATTVLRSSSGEALVLHQHGLRRAHLHVLGYSELLRNAAYSDFSGGAPNSERAASAAVRGVQVLAILLTGTALVDTAAFSSAEVPGNQTLAVTVDPLPLPPMPSMLAIDQPPLARTASAAVLRRNHSLLL